MHVLVTESMFGDADTAHEKLRAHGHEVSTCHANGGVCRAVSPGDFCPLDGDRTVDLVIDVRGLDDEELTAREYGTVCAIRAGVPLAVVSAIPSHPPVLPPGLSRHAWAYSADQLDRACADARNSGVARPCAPMGG